MSLGSAEVKAWLVDVSVSGMQVSCEWAQATCLTQRDLVRLVFVLPDDGAPLAIRGRITRIHTLRRHVLIGIRFDDSGLARGQAFEPKLMDYIMRRQREGLAIWRGWHR